MVDGGFRAPRLVAAICSLVRRASIAITNHSSGRSASDKCVETRSAFSERRACRRRCANANEKYANFSVRTVILIECFNGNQWLH